MKYKININLSVEREIDNIDDIKHIVELLLSKPVNYTSTKKSGFHVTMENNRLVRRGRPTFPPSIYKDIIAISGVEDRRHMLHGATQISDILIDSFNRIIEKDGIKALNDKIDMLIKDLSSKGHKLRMKPGIALEDKVKKVIAAAFCRKDNLVAGLAVENRGIEKARQAINGIRESIDNYCVKYEPTDSDLKQNTLKIIDAKIMHSTSGEVSVYKSWILSVLRESISEAKEVIDIIRILDDFQFSCTLDIEHECTTKEQNMWGLFTANKLNKAISEHDEDTIYDVLLGEHKCPTAS